MINNITKKNNKYNRILECSANLFTNIEIGSEYSFVFTDIAESCLNNDIENLKKIFIDKFKPFEFEYVNKDSYIEICSLISSILYDDSSIDIKSNIKDIENRAPINLLTVESNGTVTSDYGYTLADLRSMIRSSDCDKYLKDEDTITLKTTDGYTHVLQANIDTYYNYGDSAVGHHIDFIAKDLIPYSYGVRMRTTNTNNGTESIANPYLSSTESGCVLKFLESYLTKIPSAFQNYMITKRMLLPSRYSASSTTLTDDTGWYWGELPKLWIPFECEVSKTIVWSTKGFNGGCHHYPIFNKGRNIVKLCQKSASDYSRASWWLGSAVSGNSTNFCYVHSYGYFSYHNASITWLGVPLCLRFS